MRTATAWIGLGTNVGDRAVNLAAAVQALRRLLRDVSLSGVYESPPFGYTDQPAFLNMVARGRTDLQPLPLLAALKQLEQDLGRTPSFRMGPRLIDLDLLLYDDMILDAPGLTLPHPGIVERAFVLAPLTELDATLHDPRTGVALGSLLAHTSPGAVRRIGDADDLLPVELDPDHHE